MCVCMCVWGGGGGGAQAYVLHMIGHLLLYHSQCVSNKFTYTDVHITLSHPRILPCQCLRPVHRETGRPS